jgi:hypothetical protein
MIAQMLPRRKVDETEIRRQFNERRLWERAQAGQLTQHLRKERHPNPPPATEALCTRSQIVRYVDCHSRTVALVHQYLRQNGEVGASGRPDPKMLLDGSEVLYV